MIHAGFEELLMSWGLNRIALQRKQIWILAARDIRMWKNMQKKWKYQFKKSFNITVGLKYIYFLQGKSRNFDGDAEKCSIGIMGFQKRNPKLLNQTGSFCVEKTIDVSKFHVKYEVKPESENNRKPWMFYWDRIFDKLCFV